VVAGAILQHGSWRWLFLINLPIGILSIALALLFLPKDDEEKASRRELDLLGFFLLSPGLALFLYGADHCSQDGGIAVLLLSAILLACFFRRATREGERALIDLELFRGKAFSAAAVTQFIANGLSFAGQMLIPVYLIRAAGQSPAATGWLMAPLGVGMMCTYPSMGRLTSRFGIRKMSTGGAAIALLGTLPFLYLSSHRLILPIFVAALLLRGMGMSAVGIPSISAAYASVRREELPMATTALNIVQRLGGPTLTTVCATFLGWRIAAIPSHTGLARAFVLSFALLCVIHALLIAAAGRLPLSLESSRNSAAAGEALAE
jgi:MFS family permease